MKVLKAPVKRLADFETLDDPTLVKALALTTEFVAAIKRQPFGSGYCLTLAGRSGNGKTMLARAVLAELLHTPHGHCAAVAPTVIRGHLQKFEAKFYDMRKVSDRFKPPHFDFSAVDQMEELSLTILDDMAADHDPSKVTASKVDRVLRSRSQRWTLITVNLGLAEIADKLDARIASFVIRDENKFVEIKAGDYALRKLKQQQTK